MAKIATVTSLTMKHQPSVVIAGAGLSGLCLAQRLVGAGSERLRHRQASIAAVTTRGREHGTRQGADICSSADTASDTASDANPALILVIRAQYIDVDGR